MSKYIDAEKLIAEIKFAKSVYDNPNRAVYGIADAYRQDGRAAMCNDILKKIDTLQQEQPEVDLEKEILDWIGDEGSCKNGKWTWYECNKMLRYFYELGLKAGIVSKI